MDIAAAAAAAPAEPGAVAAAAGVQAPRYENEVVVYDTITVNK